MVSAPFPNRPFSLREYCWVVQQDIAGNRTEVAFQLWIDKNAYSPTVSLNGHAIRGVNFGQTGVWYESAPGWDFTGAGPWLILQGSAWAAHNNDGSRFLEVYGYADYDILGATAVSTGFWLPHIARYPPPAPNPMGLDQITKTSMRYRFNSAGDGGSPIIKWIAQRATQPDFSDALGVDSSGTTVFTDLRPGTKYYARSCGVNAAGQGPWSITSSATTLGAAYISDGTAWLNAEVLISDGAKWVPGEVLISDGTKWNPAG